jgi:hypothetical protein
MSNIQEKTSMTQPARSTPPQTEELSKEIADLVSAVEALPLEVRGDIETVLARVVDASKRRRRILQLVQDALSQLRLDMKYLLFDLEATRRERDNYRRQVEDTGNP